MVSKNACSFVPKNATKVKSAGKPNQRSASKIRTLKMRDERAVRDEKGKVLFQRFANKTAELDGRIEPDRKWFGNTRVVGQADLTRMRDAVAAQEKNPNVFLVRSKTLPTALLHEEKPAAVKIETVEPFHLTFGPKAQRKGAKLNSFDPEEILKEAQAEVEKYDPSKDKDTLNAKTAAAEEYGNHADPRFQRGQTSRIYAETFKVVDSSDVIVYVLDARDPEGTRSAFFEKYLSSADNEHKHLIFVLNKVDLVPTWCTAAWIRLLSKERPTIAFHADATGQAFGKGELITVLRQFAQLHKDRKQISVGFAGFPNVGKSSVINALLGEKSCPVAPIPGQTKVWQYVNLTNRIFLIDAPGVVFPGKDGEGLTRAIEKTILTVPTQKIIEESATKEEAKARIAEERKKLLTSLDRSQLQDASLVLRGVVRTEYIEYPEQFIPYVLKSVQAVHINKTYNLRPALNREEAWQKYEDPADKLLEIIALKMGRMLKGGDPDKRSAARRILEDYTRGKLPHFVAPYDATELEEGVNSVKRERQRWEGKTDAELIGFENTQNLASIPMTLKFGGEDELLSSLEEQRNKEVLEELAIKKKEEEDEKLRKHTHGTADKLADESLEFLDENDDSQESLVEFSEDEDDEEIDWDDKFSSNENNSSSAKSIIIKKEQEKKEEKATQEEESQKENKIEAKIEEQKKEDSKSSKTHEVEKIKRGKIHASDIKLEPDFQVQRTGKSKLSVIKSKKRAFETGTKRAGRIYKTKDREILRAATSGVVGEEDIALITNTRKKLEERLLKDKSKRKRGGASHGKTGVHFHEEVKAKKHIIEKSIGKKI